MKEGLFINGAISSEYIAEYIAKQGNKTNIGAHDIFLGQVRADEIDGNKVAAIDYTSYPEMANRKIMEIKKAAYERFNLVHIHVSHSLGIVRAGEICLFVCITSAHRKEAFEGCRYIVEEIKKDLPVWGKEIFEDDNYVWKENKF
jgi:molybdopterin synthase catalytic subunit